MMYTFEDSLRRFASKNLHMSEQIQLEVVRDHPNNIVQKIVSHKMHNGELYMMVRWKGFTENLDQYLAATQLTDSVAESVTEYIAKMWKRKRRSRYQNIHEQVLSNTAARRTDARSRKYNRRNYSRQAKNKRKKRAHAEQTSTTSINDRISMYTNE